MHHHPPTSRRSLAGLFIATLLAAVACPSLAADADRPPNIVVIFIDDMGYADIGPFGATAYKTPNLDRMAAEGRVFTDFYVAQAVCSASRAALLTGCYPNRISISGALGPGARHGLGDGEMTIAELCKQKGYATAIFGKWHLGHHEKFLPPRHGFDEYFGLPYSNDMWPNHPEVMHLPIADRLKRWPNLPLIEGDRVIDDEVTAEDQEQLTTQYTERAVAFIERNRDRPFFVYLPHSMVHVPLYVSGKFKGKSGAGLFGDVVMEVDWSVGQVLDALKRTGVDDRTLVIFTSDNGPWLSYGDHAGSAGPLREGKGTSWDGGVRVPTVMRWPGRIPAGTRCAEPAMTIDILPTVAHLIGAKLPAHKIDGLNIWPLIAGEPDAKSPHEALFFYYNANDLEAMRSGKWKLHFPHAYRTLGDRPGGTGGKPANYTPTKTGLALYDLSADPGEQHDVAADHPDIVDRLTKLADTMRADLGDNLTGKKPTGAREPGRL